jgi:hypothetical protein
MYKTAFILIFIWLFFASFTFLDNDCGRLDTFGFYSQSSCITQKRLLQDGYQLGDSYPYMKFPEDNVILGFLDSSNNPDCFIEGRYSVINTQLDSLKIVDLLAKKKCKILASYGEKERFPSARRGVKEQVLQHYFIQNTQSGEIYKMGWLSYSGITVYKSYSPCE